MRGLWKPVVAMIVILSALIILIALVNRTRIERSYSTDGRFRLVEVGVGDYKLQGLSFDIIYDTETGVEYVIGRGSDRSVMSPLYDANGNVSIRDIDG